MENQELHRISPVFVEWYDIGERTLVHSDDTYGQRVVQHYEIEYIVSSRNGYILTDNIPIQIFEQDILFRMPGMIVEGIGVYSSIYVKFDMNENGEQVNIFHALSPLFRNTGDTVNKVLMNELCLKKEASTVDILMWKAKIMNVLSKLLQFTQTDKESVIAGGEKRHLQPIKNTLLYVQQHYEENITLQNLADASGYSVYYFSRLFKNITQLTPMQYVVRYRMDQAEKDSCCQMIRLKKSCWTPDFIIMDISGERLKRFTDFLRRLIEKEI